MSGVYCGVSAYLHFRLLKLRELLASDVVQNKTKTGDTYMLVL